MHFSGFNVFILRGHGKQIFLLPDDKIATTDAGHFASLSEEGLNQIFDDCDSKTLTSGNTSCL